MSYHFSRNGVNFLPRTQIKVTTAHHNDTDTKIFNVYYFSRGSVNFSPGTKSINLSNENTVQYFERRLYQLNATKKKKIKLYSNGTMLYIIKMCTKGAENR